MSGRAWFLAIAFALAPSVRSLAAQDSTIVIGQAQVNDALARGFGFSLEARSSGARCFTLSGQNNGVGLWSRSTSELANVYATGTCRHKGFGTKALQNGWKVSSVSTTRTCRFNDFGTWRDAPSSNCTFTITAPTVGSTSAFFQADVTVRGAAGQDRQAMVIWQLQIRGPKGKSPWVLQPPGVPTLVSPENLYRTTAGRANFGWTAATGAVDFQLCISRETWTGACEQRARVTTTSATGIALPFPGERVKWFVRACNSVGCTSSSQSRFLLNALPAATLVSPAAGITASNRRPTFQWQSVPGAQTYKLSVYHPNPVTEFVVSNLSSNQTQFTPATDIVLESPVYWAVHTCTTPTGCSGPENMQQLRQLNLPPRVSFATDLAPTFMHERCVNCHAVAATFFSRVTPGLGPNHPSATSTTNCATCHTTALLPTQGTVNPGWQSAPASTDLRNLTAAQLCARATNAGTVAGSVLNHLTQDKLILWAVGDGRVPNATTKSTAPPNSITTWQTRVQNWISAGMPCN